MIYRSQQIRLANGITDTRNVAVKHKGSTEGWISYDGEYIPVELRYQYSSVWYERPKMREVHNR